MGAGTAGLAPQGLDWFLLNPLARRGSPWTAAQDAILSDRGFADAKSTIASWPGYAPTPLVDLPGLAARAGVAALHYKDESARFGLGSFKALGGAYAVARLVRRQTERCGGTGVSTAKLLARPNAEIAAGLTVCCATDGNHGRSVAWGAAALGCRCVVFIHATVSQARQQAIESYGAEVRRTAGTYDDSVRQAQATAEREGWFVVSDTSYPGYADIPKDVMQGYELMAAEALDAMDAPPTHLFLQTGVGGMAAAVVACAKRRLGAERPVVALVDPERAACWLASVRCGRPTAVGGDLDTVMAGLACGEVSLLAWEILKDHADAAMAVSDDAGVDVMRRLARPAPGDPPIVAGESAVAGIAGLLAAMADRDARAALDLGPAARVLVFGTEGATDPGLYRELVGLDPEEVRRA
jgi:diaminopropionate ammonia-lyase